MNRLLVLLVVTVLLTGGCGQQPQARPTPAAAPDHGKSASARPKTSPPPAIPQAARGKSLNGALAFATYFLELQNYALRTGQTGGLRRAIAPECLMCLALPNLIDVTYRSGGRIEGGGWIPTSRFVVQANDPGEVPSGMGFFGVNVHLQPTTVYSSDGDVVGSFEGSHHDRYLSISTRWTGGHWCVDGVSGVAGQEP